ncbi:MAG: hypothetical protein O2930_10800 [Acidobacteria bacterium]|nr:hypothetical protein [Acidobacteriota bacterium]
MTNHTLGGRRISAWPWRAGLVGLLSAATVLGMGGVVGLAQRAPSPAPTDLSAEVLSLACAPSLSNVIPDVPLRVTGSQESTARHSFAPGDLLVINAGTDDDIEVGQEYFTRRAVPLARGKVNRDNPATIRTSGWIRVYAVDDELSLATITYGCGSVEPNDYLEPFVLPEMPAVSSLRPEAQRDNYGHVIGGTDNRTAFGNGDYFIVDRGSNHGIRPGAQFVVYRDKRQPDTFLVELGEAVAVTVGPAASTLQVTVSRDAFMSGDYVALRK